MKYRLHHLNIEKFVLFLNGARYREYTDETEALEDYFYYLDKFKKANPTTRVELKVICSPAIVKGE